jgi:hypothetical protein
MNVIETISKPTLAGMTAAVLTKFVTYGPNSYGNDFKLEIQSFVPVIKMFNGSQVNLPLLTGVAVGLASLAGDLISDQVFPFLTNDQIMENIGSSAFQLGAMSSGTILAHGILNSHSIGQRGLLNIVGMSAASELISSYIHSKTIRPFFQDPSEEGDYTLG